MDLLLKILTYLFVFFSMLGIGFKVRREDIMNNLRDKSLMLRSLIANFIIVPVIAYILLKIFPLSQIDTKALMLLAIAPGGLSALQFTTKAKNRDSLGFAAALSFILTLLAIILTPILILIFRHKDFELHIPYVEFIFIALFLVLLPLVIGIYVGENKPSLAEKLARPSALFGTLVFFGMLIVTLSDASAAKSATEPKTILVILIFIVLSIITGLLLGGPLSEKRRLLAAITSMRNYALAILIIGHTLPGTGLETTVTAFASYMIPPNMLIMLSYNLYMKRKAKKLAKV